MTVRGDLAASAAALAATVLLVACGATEPLPKASGGVPVEPSLTLPPGGVTPPPASVEPSPAVIAPALTGAVRCHGLDVDIPLAVFGSPATAELGPDESAAALRNHVAEASSVETGWPARGWWLVSRTATRATFLARGATHWWIATFAKEGIQWMFDEGGNCDLQVTSPDGVGFASWRLDPAGPRAPGDLTLHLLGTEAACANGKPPGARVLQPIVLEGDDAITIALLVRQLPGEADCPANPEFPVAIGLREPLGSRDVFDGSTVPPSLRT